jgi:cytoskeletal protein RodZ
MALSMDEQRILDAMERKLADEDPLLASRLTSFGRPALPAMMRSRRARIVLSFLAVFVIAAVSLAVYALTPFRAGFAGRSTAPQVIKTAAPASRHSAQP